MPAISPRLPEEIEARLGEEARIKGRPRSEVVRETITEYLTRRDRERFMAELESANLLPRPRGAS